MRFINKFLKIASIATALAIGPTIAAADDVVRLSEGEARKLLVSKVDPEYPAMAKQMRLSGRVQVDCFVDTNGAVERVQVLNGNPLFSSSINSAMKKWRFKPFESNGKSSNIVAGFAFDFKL